MKKLILTLILCLIAVPAYAGIYIDGQLQNTDYKIINGKAYVPLRFVGEKLNATVQYDGDIKITTQQRPVIKTGTKEQKQVVNRALDLLKMYDPPHYNMICNYVKEIYIPNKQVILENNSRPYAVYINGTVVLYSDLTGNKEKFVPWYVAGVLVHEGAHASNDQVMTYHSNPNLHEEIAYEHEITALILLGAPEWAIKEKIEWQKRYLD